MLRQESCRTVLSLDTRCCKVLYLKYQHNLASKTYRVSKVTVMGGESLF